MFVDHIEFYWEVCFLRKVRTIIVSHFALDLMRAKTPSWSASNDFKVLFCVWFLLLLPLVLSLVYFFGKCKSFFGLF